MLENLEKLWEPFPLDRVHWRIGARNGDKTQGIALAYLDARDVMKRLDEVVGPHNWQCRYPIIAEGKTVCEISIWCGEDHGWITKANGAGDTQMEADKGALSDAMKRAAVLWGVGQYLYDMPNIWVELAPGGKRIKNDQYPKLAEALKNLTEVEASGNKAVHEWFRRAPTEMNNCKSVAELQDWWTRNTPFIKSLSDQDRDVLNDQKDILKERLAA